MDKITETLKEPDRYLSNKGFTGIEKPSGPGTFRVHYTLGSLERGREDGIGISLYDHGDGHWSYEFPPHASENRQPELREITNALQKMKGYEGHTV